MTKTEELVRSTARAIAGTVTQVGPLRLPAADDLSAESFDQVRDEPARKARRLGNWIAPAAAAAAVIALAVSLVLIRDAPSGGDGTPVGPVPGETGLPRYFVRLTGSNGVESGLIVGDTFTGRKVATVAAPKGLTFAGVSAAADDRTFAVDAGSARLPDDPRFFYLLRIAPGSASPARLTRLPIAPVAFATRMALSDSGRELAVTSSGESDILRIYSVATGRQLRGWSASGLFNSIHIIDKGNPIDDPGFRWVDGDRAIVFLATDGQATASLRRLDVAAGGRDLAKASKVIFTESFSTRGGHRGCLDPPLVSGDGKTIVCVSDAAAPLPAGYPGYQKPTWHAYQAGSAAPPRTLYQAALRRTASEDGYGMETLWASQSGDTVLVSWFAIRGGGTIVNLRFGVISRGRFTALPSSLATKPLLSSPPLIAW
jgi:hypothetical protein